MLDLETYRALEMIATNESDSFRKDFRHCVDRWFAAGLPVRVSSLGQLRRIVDHHSPGRFISVMNELGGLAKEEFFFVVKILREYIAFQLAYFSDSDPILPFDTMLAMYAAYKKIIALMPRPRYILEIGPGNGLLAFFFNKIEGLENYSQIEVAESFYLLQHYINLFVFRDSFSEMCRSGGEGAPLFVADRKSHTAHYFSELNKTKRCCHYPWWGIRKVYERNCRYDVIVSNSNLCEMYPETLEDYLTLIETKLSDDGIFFLQGFGSQKYEKESRVLKRLYKHNLAPLIVKKSYRRLDGTIVPLSKDYAVFVGKGHSFFEECFKNENYTKDYVYSNDFEQQLFLSDHCYKKKFYTENDFIRAVPSGYRVVTIANNKVYMAASINGDWKDEVLCQLKNKRLAVWGIKQDALSHYIKPYLQELDIKYFCDSNCALRGTTTFDIPVITPAEIDHQEGVDAIIVAAKSLEQIVFSISEHVGLKDVPIYSF